MPQIYLDGLQIDLAQSDGEILDVCIDCADEFAEAHPDYTGDLRDYVTMHMRRAVDKLIDWELEPEWSRNGCPNQWQGA